MNRRFFLIISFLALFIISCKKDKEFPVSSKNYFPLNNGRTWTYSQLLRFGDMKEYDMRDTGKVYVKDTTISGKSLNIFKDEGMPAYFLRDVRVKKENGTYYRLNHFSEVASGEWIPFLRDKCSKGDFWQTSKDQYGNYRKFEVKNVYDEYNVAGKVYKDVVEIRETYIPTEGLRVMELTFMYANNIGLIYSYLPYPESFTYADVTYELLDNK
jgi:hypothetical protein